MENYNQPNLEWRDTSVPSAQDFNRIEGNIDYLKKNKVDNSTLAENNGVATLDENGNVVQKAACIAPLNFTGGVAVSYDGRVEKGVAIPTVLPTPNALTVGNKTFNGSTPVSIEKSDLGLGNVDNTSDANKPVSTAQQAALDGKVDKVAGKQLSTEDYTSVEKTKLSGIAEGANSRGREVYR